MPLIPGKQIKDISANKILETAEKQLVAAADKISWNEKATGTDIDTAVSAAKAEIETLTDSKIETAKTEVDTATDTKIANALATQYDNDSIDLKINEVKTNIKYKGTAPTLSEVPVLYPTPLEGWKVAVEDEKMFYVYDADTSSWQKYPESISTSGHSKTIPITVIDNQTVINTGIRLDGSGANQTDTLSIQLFVNGFLQTPIVDYTVANVADVLVITWLDSQFVLEAADTISVSFNQIA